MLGQTGCQHVRQDARHDCGPQHVVEPLQHGADHGSKVIQDIIKYVHDKGQGSGPKDEVVLDRIRHRLRTGRPAGEDGFVRGLEQETGRRMAALPRGRPRKALIIPNTPRSNP